MRDSDQSLAKRGPDFEAEVRFLRGARKTCPFVGTYRPDISYFEDVPGGGAWMVHPVLWWDGDKKLNAGDEIPPIARATFFILSPEFRPMHRERLHIGREFRIVEGSHIVALARVTRILHLNDDVENA